MPALDGASPSVRLDDFDWSKLEPLKAKLQPVLEAAPPFPEVVGDVRLLRFLIACKGDVTQAAQKFEAMLLWRRRLGVDKIRQQIVAGDLKPCDHPLYSTVMKYWRVQLFQDTDCEGNPVIWDTVGSFDGAALLTELTEQQVVEFHLFLLEWKMLLLERLSRATGRLAQAYEVKDMNGVGLGLLRPCNLSLFKAIADATTGNYVESTRRVSILNAGWFFGQLWKAVEGWIPERTKQKIRNLDSRQHLQKDIPMDRGQDMLVQQNDPGAWPSVVPTSNQLVW